VLLYTFLPCLLKKELRLSCLRFLLIQEIPHVLIDLVRLVKLDPVAGSWDVPVVGMKLH